MEIKSVWIRTELEFEQDQPPPPQIDGQDWSTHPPNQSKSAPVNDLATIYAVIPFGIFWIMALLTADSPPPKKKRLYR